MSNTLSINDPQYSNALSMFLKPNSIIASK